MDEIARRNDTSYVHRSFSLWQGVNENVTNVCYLPRIEEDPSLIRVRGLSFFNSVSRNRFSINHTKVLCQKTGMFYKDCYKIRSKDTNYILYKPPDKHSTMINLIPSSDVSL